MRHAFDIHNTVGRFFDERIYQEELAERCGVGGMEVHREVQICVSHEEFVKSYYLDLMVQRGVVYELKAVESLTGEHEKQLINYLLLTNLNHGKLVNFRPGSVESRFVSTSLKLNDRKAFNLDEDAWDGADDASCQFRECLHGLLSDWGAFLEANLYREALLYLLSGPDAGVSPVEITLGGRLIGVQKMCMLSTDTTWHLSAIRRNFRAYETHFRRLLDHTRLRRVHWINLDHETITLKTLKK